MQMHSADRYTTPPSRDSASQQGPFAQALLDPSLPLMNIAIHAPAQATNTLPQRFSVHRNNVVGGLVNNMVDAFPVTRALVGEDYFCAVAAEYVRGFPPQSPVLSEYGATLAEFLRQVPSLQPYRYVADVAQLEWLRRRAFHSADQSVMTLTVLRQLPMTQVLFQQIELHPSVQLLRSDHPVVTLWRSQMDKTPAPTSECWQPELALIWRPAHTVYVAVIPAKQFDLLEQLRSGAVLADAMAATGAPLKDISQHFSTLVQAGAFSELAESPATDRSLSG